MGITMPQRRTNRSMSGVQLLHKAAKSKQWKYLVSSADDMRGSFGETDSRNRVIRINKKLHAQKSGGHLIKNKDGTESMIGTMVHEELHKWHPKAHEKTVRKVAKKKVKVMNSRQKKRLYAKYNNK